MGRAVAGRLANRPESVWQGDGLVATGVWVTAAVRCPPPQNRPWPEERDNCLPYLERELAELSGVRAVLALGNFAYEAVCRVLGVRPRPPFAHGAEVLLANGRALVRSYHPSQQNTFTGRLTQHMLDSAVGRAVELIERPALTVTAGGARASDRPQPLPAVRQHR